MFSVYPESTLYRANSLTIDTGFLSGMLTDPFTLSITPKNNPSLLSLPTTQQLTDAAMRIGEFAWSWLSTFADQFFTDPVNDIAVAGVITCFIPTGITQATTCPASLGYIESSLAQTGVVTLAIWRLLTLGQVIKRRTISSRPH